MDFSQSCEEMASLVTEAIDDIVGHPDAGVIIGMGADGTPTKKIDKIAEDIVVEYLASSDLCGILVSEECGRLPAGEGSGTLFLDPIDGTHNAVAGIPFFAISAALAHNGVVEFGFVKDLAHGDTFYAERGEGAFVNGTQIKVSSVRLLEESAISVYGRKFNPDTVLRLGQKIRRWRLLGASSLELCYVGAGRIDGFVDIRDTLRVTDAAAGVLICEEAGGTVTDMNGRHLDLPEEVTAGRTLVASNPFIHSKIIEYLR